MQLIETAAHEFSAHFLFTEYGSVSLRSKYVAELVHDAVKEAKEATRRAAEAGAKAIEAAERGGG